MTIFFDHYFELVIVLIWFITGAVFFFAFKDIFKSRKIELEQQDDEPPQNIYSEKMRRIETTSLRHEIARRKKFEDACREEKIIPEALNTHDPLDRTQNPLSL